MLLISSTFGDVYITLTNDDTNSGWFFLSIALLGSFANVNSAKWTAYVLVGAS